MTPQMESIIQNIGSFKEALVLKLAQEEGEEQEILDNETFCTILSALPSFRRLPGVPEHMGFEGIYHCDSEENKQELKNYLDTLGIRDEQTLIDQKFNLFHIFNEYFDFACEWDGHPNFALEDLDDTGKANYTASRDFAMNLRDFVGSQGFLGWDIGERIMLVRACAACGIIDDETCIRLIVEEAKIANDMFDNFIDFAISALCGCVYFMFVQMDRTEEEGLSGFLDINMKIVSKLFEDDIWSIHAWCEKNYKQLAINDDQVQTLLGPEYRGKTAIAADRILCDGYRICVMLREEPMSDIDTGWRFFAGDEDPEYLQNGNNFGALDLNLICNYSPDVVRFLARPVGTFILRGEDDKLHVMNIVNGKPVPADDDNGPDDPVAVG